MDLKIKTNFIQLWKKYFNGADLPITFYYTEEVKKIEEAKLSPKTRCLICALSPVRKGKSLCFSVDNIGCAGGKRYLGFTRTLRPNFEYFLSCGIPGKLEGERYKKTPEMVKEIMKKMPEFKAPAKYIIFKRWDKLDDFDHPEVVIFFSTPDVLSGLFTLTSFDEVESSGVIAPFSAGCGSIVQYPYFEKNSDHPRAVLGMFDVSARPCVPEETLTFSVPINKFTRMIGNMEESFLTTPSWSKVKKRIAK
jgi:uncharacterized protein (DUF169 family)